MSQSGRILFPKIVSRRIFITSILKSQKDTTDNESLKYTPPKPSQPQAPSEEQKATQCILACALFGYEWTNNAYIARGKLGFAIIKVLKRGSHNLILYDSNKVTLSNMTISNNFEVTVKENVYFSYFDNLQKYWCLNATEEEMRKIVNLLKSFNVNIKYSSNKDKDPPEIDIPVSNISMKNQTEHLNKDSDTDSSVKRKTKMSIINRMASMGQSVLPPRTISKENSSESSDSNVSDEYKSVRHKPLKIVAKRTRCDKNVNEDQTVVDSQKLIVPTTEVASDNMTLFSYINGQIVPVTNCTTLSNSNTSVGNDFKYFVSEQRVNNSELRININRVTDKVDEVLNKVSKLENKENNSETNSFQMEIMQKLLAEYENKIKIYEDFIKRNKTDMNSYLTETLATEKENYGVAKEIEKELKEKIRHLEKLCEEKDAELCKVKTEIKVLQSNYEEEINKEKKHNESLSNDILILNRMLTSKNEELLNQKKCENLDVESGNKDDLGNNIKNIMNDTYHAISASFENDENYTGATVKTVTASVIKKVTIESLSTI